MLCVWTANSHVARGVGGWPWAGLWTLPGNFSVQVASVVNGSPTCPVSSGAPPYTFLHRGQAVPSDQQWHPNPHLLQASQPPVSSFISESPALGSLVSSPGGLLHPCQPGLVAPRGACPPCTPISPHSDCHWLSVGLNHLMLKLLEGCRSWNTLPKLPSHSDIIVRFIVLKYHLKRLFPFFFWFLIHCKIK